MARKRFYRKKNRRSKEHMYRFNKNGHLTRPMSRNRMVLHMVLTTGWKRKHDEIDDDLPWKD